MVGLEFFSLLSLLGTESTANAALRVRKAKMYSTIWWERIMDADKEQVFTCCSAMCAQRWVSIQDRINMNMWDGCLGGDESLDSDLIKHLP